MRRLIYGASLSAMLLAIGCAAKPQAASKASVPQPDPRNPVIVHIVNQHRTITVSSSPRGLLYSMKDAHGNMQIADATEQQFQELQPELYHNIKHYIAVHADDAPVISAGRDAEAIPWSGVDSPTPSLNLDKRGRVSGVNADQFKRTSERPFPTARHDASE